MDKLKPYVDYLKSVGIENISHTQKTYMGHLVAVYRFLEERGCDEEVCRGGMFHSIYGTERFQGFKLPLDQRPAVRALIGARAERLAYLNCAMDRASFDRAVERGKAPFLFVDRITGQEVELAARDFDDLCRIHLYDWLEQAPRTEDWSYRREPYRRMAARLGRTAEETCEKVYAELASR